MLARPVLTPPGGSFTGPVAVVITADAGEVRYTLDGTTPRRRSPLYGAPIEMVASGTLKARCFTADDRSRVATGTFEIVVVEPGRTRVTIPDTIPGADGGDQTAALQAFFDDAGDGLDIYVPRLYRFDGAGPRLAYRRDVRVFGPGGFTTPTDGFDVAPTPGHEHGWPRTRNRMTLVACEDVVVQQILLEGSNQTNLGEEGYVEELEGQHGVDISGGQRITIGNREGETGNGIQIRFIRGDWIYLGGGRVSADPTSERRWAADVRVCGNDFSYNGRQGFGITGAERVLIEDNAATYCRRTTIDIEPNGPGGGVTDLAIRRNRFGLGHLTWLTIHRTGRLERIVVDGNAAQRANIVMPLNDGSRLAGLRLIDNTSSQPVGNPQGAAWKLEGVDGLDVRGNRIAVQGNRDMYLLRLDDCTGVFVDDNEPYAPSGGAIGGVVHPDSVYTAVDVPL